MTDGKQTASLSAMPLGDAKIEVAVVADIPEAKEEQKELAMRVMDKVFERCGLTEYGDQAVKSLLKRTAGVK